MKSKLSEQGVLVEGGRVALPLYTCLHVKKNISAKVFQVNDNKRNKISILITFYELDNFVLTLPINQYMYIYLCTYLSIFYIYPSIFLSVCLSIHLQDCSGCLYDLI